MPNQTFTALFRNNQWAQDLILQHADSLTAAQLDAPVDMSMGSLRETLRHVLDAERVWQERITQPGSKPGWSEKIAIPIAEWRTELAQRHEGWLSILHTHESRLDEIIAYQTTQGVAMETRLADILMHVCNHGIHHRAQLTNMLRHCGITLNEIGYGYWYWKKTQRPDDPAVDDLKLIRSWFSYADWAQSRVINAAQSLDDAALDREFEMGLGTLRKTIDHIRWAERWWQGHWNWDAQTELKPSRDAARFASNYAAVTANRNRMLDTLGTGDLQRRVPFSVSDTIHYEIGLGDSLLQLCLHGTHHRAQILNILRQLGETPPMLDHIIKVREHAPQSQPEHQTAQG